MAHATQTIVGAVWALTAWHINPAFFWWISPITFGLLVSIPLSALLGYVGVGAALQRLGLFGTPMEIAPTSVVRKT